MILIITHKADFTADFIINKLNHRGVAYKRFNCEDILFSDLTVRFEPNLKYSIFGENNYRSVWFRRTKLPEIKNLPTEERYYILSETDSLLKNLFSILSAKWLSSPTAVYEAENKLRQLEAARRIGFNIPNTLITTSKNELKKFYEANERDIIIKPISQTRISLEDDSGFIFTNQISQKHIDELDQFDLTPCIFQKNILKKYEIRATIVGEKVFAAKVYSQEDEITKLDWRKKRLNFIEDKLPSEIENLCIQLLKELDLGFGAIDLIKSADGQYYFLEINPNGQWVWIENQTGLKISEAIIEYLTDE